MNEKLRSARLRKNWSQERAASEIGITRKTYIEWEKGEQRAQPSTRDLACRAFGMSAEELGLYIIEGATRDRRDVALQSPHTIVLTAEQIASLSSALLGDSIMANFDNSRRDVLMLLLKAAGISLTMPAGQLLSPEPWDRLTQAVVKPHAINEDSLMYFEKLVETCWGLSYASEPETVQDMLPKFLPKITAIAQTPSQHQKRAASIAAQGYILAAEVDKKNVPALEKYCDIATEYSQLAGDYSIQTATLKQQATIALIAKKTDKALQTYQRALPLVRYVSPLLRSRIYMGLASAYARCGQQSDAQRYIGLAHDTFPDNPESDPAYSYTVCTQSVLHLYDGLAYMDLDQPQQAWNALANVEGLHPKMHVAESWRIEVINLQASAAAGLKDMETACTYVEAGANAAQAQGYEIWSSESADVYQQIKNMWPRETKVKQLAGLFQQV